MADARILVVEDETVVSLDICQQLQQLGYTVAGTAVTGEQAVELALQRLPDLILMDIKLRGPMDGTEAAARIRAEVDIPIIFLTAFADEHSLERAKVSGPFGYILKPLDEHELAINLEISLYKHKLERALRQSEERYMLALQGSNDGIWDWDLVANKVYFSERWAQMLGYQPNEIRNDLSGWLWLVHSEDSQTLITALSDHTEGLTPFLEVEHRMVHRNGEVRWVLTRGKALRDAAGSAYRMSGSQTDITDRKKIEQQLVHNAFHDALTGLPNRALLIERLDRAIQRLHRRPDDRYAVLFLDLDRFKIVNDSLGHTAGDELIKTIATKLNSLIRASDTSARVGGDEFVVLQEGITGPKDSLALAERILGELQTPIPVHDQMLNITASIGIVLGEPVYEQAIEVLRDADIAMYRAKEHGRGRYEVFRSDFRRKVLKYLEMETLLRRGLANNEFHVHYQPVVALSDNRVVGFEALLRWSPEGYPAIPPSEFIPVAEESGLIIPIGEWVLHTACRQLCIWQERYPLPAPLWVSVNLSTIQFMQPDLGQDILNILRETGLPPTSLRLEITESHFMENPQLATKMLQSLVDQGVKISIDDFGTGYSSLSSLHQYPIHTLKIDRTFITLMDTTDKNRDIVRTIIQLAYNLNMETIAEGVETREQSQALTRLECRYAQGFIFSRPCAAEQIETILHDGGRLTETARPEETS